ncbi:hypothetical protein ACIBHX_38975 [Nonomuraea sp. NPDC050536]|uniref:hypothetical protein n=1 Tax=Nonomuraea sp. NPDC050536 TaxID=3364366 RepID=UPI0037CBD25F
MWWILIEENHGSSDAKEWRTSTVKVNGDRWLARAKAEELARTHVPRHPAFAQRRSVLKVDDDHWVTIVQGATRDYHFRVTVAELVHDE